MFTPLRPVPLQGEAACNLKLRRARAHHWTGGAESWIYFIEWLSLPASDACTALFQASEICVLHRLPSCPRSSYNYALAEK